MNPYTFTGHDTFHCRQFWLKKGFDLVFYKKKGFSDEAVVDLGVGKNMVSAVRHWLRAFDLYDEHKKEIKSHAQKIFENGGFDPYLEDIGTLWLLHYWLVCNEPKASTFHLIFNNLREERPEFNEDHYLKFVSKFAGEQNQNSLKKDFSVFIRTYLGKKNDKDLEDSFSGVLSELGLIEEQERTFIDEKGQPHKRTNYLIQRKARPQIPHQIILYAIASNTDYGKSINFEDLYQGKNSVGTVFALSREGLMEKLEKVAHDSSFKNQVVLSSEAGIRELQFPKQKPGTDKILADYYDEN